MRLFITGPLGFGKTSILHAARRNMARKGAIVLYVSAEAKSVAKLLVEDMVA